MEADTAIGLGLTIAYMLAFVGIALLGISISRDGDEDG